MFFFIFIIILILGYSIYTSRIGIEIENLVIDTQKPKGEKINKDSKIYIYILVFKKIKLFKKDVKNQKIKFRNKDIDLKLLKERDLEIDYKELLQKPDIYIEKINLNVQLGTQDAALTAILTGIVGARTWCSFKKT